ncbi:MAG: hypothetical protein EA393_11365 [Bacteroidetes bacterium]|nr:MAG: hypothetical protein EA393_11365 [Bacteroidota bacterium]
MPALNGTKNIYIISRGIQQSPWLFISIIKGEVEKSSKRVNSLILARRHAKQKRFRYSGGSKQ